MNDRPIECSNCKKVIKIIYKEIDQKATNETHMCEECPILQSKLQGEGNHRLPLDESVNEKFKGLTCGSCNTSYDSILSGNLLGCCECYNTFEEAIASELITAEKVGAKAKPSIEKKKTHSLHVGKTPHESEEIALSKKIQELNEALNDALKRENYEQAAWLRDQIKEITETSHE